MPVLVERVHEFQYTNVPKMKYVSHLKIAGKIYVINGRESVFHYWTKIGHNKLTLFQKHAYSSAKQYFEEILLKNNGESSNLCH